jgi:hypothetical protein
MSGARTRKPATIGATAGSEPQVSNDHHGRKRGGNGESLELKDDANDYQGENIYMFMPNLIGTRN